MPDIKKYLNRDGLEEYNSLLPHSGAEMQEYVNAWLDDHPEATTTVQDGAITEPKLADKSVSLRTIADDTMHMLKGMMLTRKLIGNMLTAADAYSAPPTMLTITGKSTQDGTPTPDAPVEIVSIEQANLTFAGKNILDPSFLTRCGWTESNGQYTGTPRQLYQGLANHILPVECSANTQYVFAWNQISSTNTSNTNAVDFKFVYSDGTQSASRYTDLNNLFAPISAEGKTVVGLRFSYVSNPTLVVRCIQLIPLALYDGEIIAGYIPYAAPNNVLLQLTQALRSLPDGTHDELLFAYLRPSTREGLAWYTPTLTALVGETATAVTDGITGTVGVDVMSTTGEIADGPTVLYKLANPITTQLDPIELPILHAPDVTVWSDPATVLKMSYMRDANIVISDIEQAIADL